MIKSECKQELPPSASFMNSVISGTGRHICGTQRSVEEEKAPIDTGTAKALTGEKFAEILRTCGDPSGALKKKGTYEVRTKRSLMDLGASSEERRGRKASTPRGRPNDSQVSFSKIPKQEYEAAPTEKPKRDNFVAVTNKEGPRGDDDSNPACEVSK